MIFSKLGPGNRKKHLESCLEMQAVMGIFPGGCRREMGEYSEIATLGVPKGGMRKSALGQIPSTGFRPLFIVEGSKLEVFQLRK